jgi:large subunit ribosomal protein L16
MLLPKRTKHRKVRRGGKVTGVETRGTEISFGKFGIQALEHCMLTNRQIEAARISMTRKIKRGGKVWIRVFPDRPFTRKPVWVKVKVTMRVGQLIFVPDVSCSK